MSTDTATTSAPPTPSERMPAAKQPVGTGASPAYAVLLAVVLIALGVVGVQEGFVRSNAIDTASWTRTAVTKANDLDPADWMLAVFIALIILGLLVLVSVFKPRKRTSLALNSDTGVYLRPKDLGRIIEHAATDVDGVTDVQTAASRRRLNITVTALTPSTLNAETIASINNVIEPDLAALQRRPRTKTTIKNQDLT
ncbi:MAG: alkaline shock response membrane anchor protein AmaP [Actinomycetota bacterium]|nr:alkaline shock response membrane anchor protein AmaP [Actinomycetota bacterium]